MSYNRRYGGYRSSDRDDSDYYAPRRPAYNTGQSSSQPWERKRNEENDNGDCSGGKKGDVPQKAQAKQAQAKQAQAKQAPNPPLAIQVPNKNHNDKKKEEETSHKTQPKQYGNSYSRKDDAYARARPTQSTWRDGTGNKNNDDDDDDFNESQTVEDYLNQLTLSPRGQHLVLKKPGERGHGNFKFVVEDVDYIFEHNELEDVKS